jgi:hypothetical protein
VRRCDHAEGAGQFRPRGEHGSQLTGSMRVMK